MVLRIYVAVRGGRNRLGRSALVMELLGPERSAAFWQKWRENYVTREDTARCTGGVQCDRVPLHYNLFESDGAEGFKLLDRLIGWCKAEKLYVMLDLHAAPGGQTARTSMTARISLAIR